MSLPNSCDVNVIINHSIFSLPTAVSYVNSVKNNKFFMLVSVKNTFDYTVEKYYSAALDVFTFALKNTISDLAQRNTTRPASDNLITTFFNTNEATGKSNCNYVDTQNSLFSFFSDLLKRKHSFLDLVRSGDLSSFEESEESASDSFMFEAYLKFKKQFTDFNSAPRLTPTIINNWYVRLQGLQSSNPRLFVDGNGNSDEEDLQLAAEFFSVCDRRRVKLSAFDRSLIYSINFVISNQTLSFPQAIDLN